jgi:hypothetical protein
VPYSLVPIIDVGPSRLPWVAQRRMPLGLDQGGNCIHLGPNNALVWTPAPIADVRAVTLADDPADTLATATRTRLTTLAGDGREFPVGSRQFSQAIRDLLVNAPADRRWEALIPTKAGSLEAYLGPGGVGANVLFRETVARRGPASKDIQDDFNRSGNLDGSTTSDAQTTWVGDQGTGYLVDGDEADFSDGANFCVARLALDMDTADHYVQADITRYSRAGGGLTVGIMLRADAAPTSGYAWETGQDAAGSERRVYNFATDATIASDTTAPATGLLYLELNGSTYTAKLAGATIFTGTDTTHPGTTAKGCGFQGFSNFIGNTAGHTSFRAADLVGGGGLTDGWKILLH